MAGMAAGVVAPEEGAEEVDVGEEAEEEEDTATATCPSSTKASALHPPLFVSVNVLSLFVSILLTLNESSVHPFDWSP